MSQERRIRELEKRLSRLEMLSGVTRKTEQGKVVKGRPNYRQMLLKHFTKK